MTVQGGGYQITPPSGYGRATPGGGTPGGLTIDPSRWRDTAAGMYNFAVQVMGQDWVSKNLGSLADFAANKGHQATFSAIAAGRYSLADWRRAFVADRLYNYALQSKGAAWVQQNYGSLTQFRANKSHWGTFASVGAGTLSYDQWSKTFDTRNGGGPGATAGQRDAYATLLATLQDYGLGSLADWLWKEITSDTPTSQIFLDLRQTDPYKQRFPGLVARQDAGLSAMSEAEYLRTENDLRRVLKQHGVDPGTNPSAFTDYFKADLSPDEVNSRAEMWDLLTKSPQTAARVKGMFEQFTGMGNVSDDQLFQMLVQDDSDLLGQLHHGLSTNGVQTLSLSNVKSQIQRAMAAEAATFAGGGGQTVSQQGVKTGLVGVETERF